MSESTEPTLEMSATPENRFSFWCDPKEQRRSYYSCLKTVEWVRERIKNGETLSPEADWRNDCAAAIQSGRCTAIAMREEEQKEGKPIYFVRNLGTLDRPSPERQETRPLGIAAADREESYQRGWEKAEEAMMGKKPKRKSAFSSMFKDKPGEGRKLKPAKRVEPAKPKPKKEPAPSSMDMGRVITEMAAEEREKPKKAESKPVEKKETVKKSSAPEKPGKPSLLDIARKRKKEVVE